MLGSTRFTTRISGNTKDIEPLFTGKQVGSRLEFYQWAGN